MYRFIAAISILIRGCYLPNPFENYAYNIWSDIEYLKPLGPYMMQAIFEPLLWLIAYSMAGQFYDGHIKALGSLLFLVSYFICNTVVCIMCIHGFTVHFIILALVGCLILTFLLRNKINEMLF